MGVAPNGASTERPKAARRQVTHRVTGFLTCHPLRATQLGSKSVAGNDRFALVCLRSGSPKRHYLPVHHSASALGIPGPLTAASIVFSAA